jgi:hypothetical protein
MKSCAAHNFMDTVVAVFDPTSGLRRLAIVAPEPKVCVQHIHGLVHPAALLAGIAIDLFQRGPEAHGAVANRQPGDVHAPRFQLQQHFPPALGGFPSAILNGQKPFLTAVIDADDH